MTNAFLELNNKEYVFFYDNKRNLFAITINGIGQFKLLEYIYKIFTPNECDIYNINGELNVELIKYILDFNK